MSKMKALLEEQQYAANTAARLEAWWTGVQSNAIYVKPVFGFMVGDVTVAVSIFANNAEGNRTVTEFTLGVEEARDWAETILRAIDQVPTIQAQTGWGETD